MQRFLFRVLLALALTLPVAACGVEDGTRLAKIEKAQIAIDKGDYDGALATLQGLCPGAFLPTPDFSGCDDELIALIAEAQMGSGGVDALSLLSAMDGLVLSDSTTVFNVFDTMFGAAGATAAEVTSLASALTTLQAIAAPTANDQLQLAVAAAAHMVASVIVTTDPTNSGTYTPGLVTPTLAATVTTDLAIVNTQSAAVDAALGSGTDVTTNLQGLQNDIEGGSPDGTVTTGELTTFVGLL